VSAEKRLRDSLAERIRKSPYRSAAATFIRSERPSEEEPIKPITQYPIAGFLAEHERSNFYVEFRDADGPLLAGPLPFIPRVGDHIGTEDGRWRFVERVSYQAVEPRIFFVELSLPQDATGEEE
jgi:hypothetical protein